MDDGDDLFLSFFLSFFPSFGAEFRAFLECKLAPVQREGGDRRYSGWLYEHKLLV